MGPPAVHRQCPACRRRLDKCRGRSRLLLPLLPGFTLPLDPSLNTAIHDRICEACYRRGTRSWPTHPQPSTYSLPLQTSNLSLLTHPPLSYQPLLSLLHPPPHLHLFRLDLSPLLLAPFLMSPTLRSNSAVIVHRLSESESWWKPWLLSLLPRNGHSFVPGRELIVVC
jgi:hypothetical protein